MKKTKNPPAKTSTTTEVKKYPLQIPEAQGDLADRAEIEIEQEIQAAIWQSREKLLEIEAAKKVDKNDKPN
jgi:hypothetical protein